MMTNDLEKLARTESAVESTGLQETNPESKEFNEAELKELAEQAGIQIEAEEKRVIDNADKQIAPPPSLDFEQSKAGVVLERGGFSSRIQEVKIKITQLVKAAKEKVAALISAKPEASRSSEIADEAAQQAEVTQSEQSPPETGAVEKEGVGQGAVAEKQVEAEETPERKENHELREYLEKKVFPGLALTEEDEKKAIAEAPESKRGNLEHSFENVRNTLTSLYELDVVDGRIDAIAYNKEQKRLKSQVLVPVFENAAAKIQPELTKCGIGISLEALSLGKDEFDIDDVSSKLNGVEGRLNSAVEEQIHNEFVKTIQETGEWEGVTMPTPEQLQDREFLQARGRKIDEATNRKKYALLDQIGFSNWRAETIRALEKIQNDIITGDNPMLKDLKPKDFYVKKSKEDLTQELFSELEKVKETNFICVNIAAKKLEDVLASGGFKDIFSLNEQELEEMKRVKGRGHSDYLAQRKAVEEGLGTYDPERSTIYGTYASDNGREEKLGGAEMYGSIFLKIKPTVDVVYCEGDSMSGDGSPTVSDKIRKKGIDRLEWSRYAQARLVAPEHAQLSKTIRNIDNARSETLTGAGLSPMDYLEAQIKDLKLEDIESINIPRSVIEPWKGYTPEEGNYRDFVARLQNDPKWKDRINIVE